MDTTTEGEEGNGKAVNEDGGEDDKVGDGLNYEGECVEGVDGRNCRRRQLGSGEG